MNNQIKFILLKFIHINEIKFLQLSLFQKKQLLFLRIIYYLTKKIKLKVKYLIQSPQVQELKYINYILEFQTLHSRILPSTLQSKQPMQKSVQQLFQKCLKQSHLPYTLKQPKSNCYNNLCQQTKSSSLLTEKGKYGFAFTKKTKKGFNWDNSSSSLQNICFQSNVAELINKQGTSLQQSYQELSELLSLEDQQSSFQKYVSKLGSSHYQQVQNYVISQKNLFWQHKSNFLFKQLINGAQIQKTDFDKLQQKMLNISQSNQHLDRGKHQEYSDYPLSKLLEISLRFLKLHNIVEGNPQKYYTYNTGKCKLYGQEGFFSHWCNLQLNIKLRMHNCSVKDYLRVLYIGLQSYSFYKFDENFLKSTLIGAKKQIPLMDEEQLLQLFYVISLRNRQAFDHIELKRLYTLKIGNQKRTVFDSDDVCYFDHVMLYDLQNKILQKMRQKYHKKYIENKFASSSNAFKQADLIKLLTWIKNCLILKNNPKSSYSQTYSYLAKFFEIILQRNSQTLNLKTTPGKNDNQLQIFCKFCKFNYFDNLSQAFNIFKACKQFIQVQQKQITTQQKLVELYWIKSGIEGVIKRIIRQNKTMIIEMVNQNLSKNDGSFYEVLKTLQVLNYIIVQQKNTEQFKIFDEEKQKIMDIFYKSSKMLLQLNQDNYENQNQISDISSNLLQIGYYLWNDKSHPEKFQRLNHLLNFNQTYQAILKGFQKGKKCGDNQIQFLTSNPKLITNLITIEFRQYFKHYASVTQEQFNSKISHFYEEQPKTNQKNNDNYELLIQQLRLKELIEKVFKSKDFILSYGQSILGLKKDRDLQSQIFTQKSTKVVYILQMQWPLYNYFKLLQLTLVQYLTACKRAISITYSNIQYEDDDLVSKINEHQGFNMYASYTKRLDAILTIMHERNQKANQYMRHVYNMQSVQSPSKVLMPVGNNMNFKKQTKYTIQGQALGVKILERLNQSKIQYERNQAIGLLKKFFTQIRAFDIKFSYPVTNFNVPVMFYYQDAILRDSHILNFYSTQDLKKKSTEVQRLMLQMNGQHCENINLDQFLAMNINERVRLLREILKKKDMNTIEEKKQTKADLI